jgi:hypothetical protein
VSTVRPVLQIDDLEIGFKRASGPNGAAESASVREKRLVG